MQKNLRLPNPLKKNNIEQSSVETKKKGDCQPKKPAVAQEKGAEKLKSLQPTSPKKTKKSENHT